MIDRDIPELDPSEWLCGLLSIKPVEGNFKLVGITKHEDGSTTLRILQRDTGAVWQFVCSIERRAA